ncbi:MAG TPA: VPLPA-CTERM sorting domain-containing protein, partial [Gammaproteobacteria bacterium]
VGIDYNENNQSRNFNVWTGSNADGTSAGINALGSATVRWGESTFGSSGWISHGNQSSSVSYALYALSSPLTAPVPVPAAAWLFGSGMLALVGLSRRGPAQSGAVSE